MSNRREFSKPVKRAALERSQMRCEAVGAMYGLEDGIRCTVSLSFGVEFDHIVLDANSKDNSLENCAATCIKCHRYKTAKHDIPMAAKTVRMKDKAVGIKAKTQPIQSAGFAKRERPDRPKKPVLPPRPLYE